VFDGYTEDGFRAAAEERFEIAAREPIEGSGRVLYLLRRRAGRVDAEAAAERSPAASPTPVG
jgi:hypothetical protein